MSSSSSSSSILFSNSTLFTGDPSSNSSFVFGGRDEMDNRNNVGIAVGSNIILFTLICCMSATVEFDSFQKQCQNKKGIATGVVLQFVVLPFLGYVVCKVCQLNELMGISLLLITSSPGGSYSNLFCSVFNADLALSVTMTAISTMFAIGCLPLNIYIYANLAYGKDIVSNLNWVGLSISLAVVISAILIGLFISYQFGTPAIRTKINRLGSLAGITLIVYSALAPEGDSVPLLGKSVMFYVAGGLPILLALIISTFLSIYISKLKKPECVAVTVECCYQNTSIAISVALTIYPSGSEQQMEALAISFYYTGLQTLILALYCLVAWKLNMTKADKNENVCHMLFNSYEIQHQMETKNTNNDNNTTLIPANETTIITTTTLPITYVQDTNNTDIEIAAVQSSNTTNTTTADTKKNTTATTNNAITTTTAGVTNNNHLDYNDEYENITTKTSESEEQ